MQTQQKYYIQYCFFFVSRGTFDGVLLDILFRRFEEWNRILTLNIFAEVTKQFCAFVLWYTQVVHDFMLCICTWWNAVLFVTNRRFAFSRFRIRFRIFILLILLLDKHVQKILLTHRKKCLRVGYLHVCVLNTFSFLAISSSWANAESRVKWI